MFMENLTISYIFPEQQQQQQNMFENIAGLFMNTRKIVK